MPFLRIRRIPHKCHKPSTGRYYAGTVWECPDCHKQWIIELAANGADKYWREMNPDEYLGTPETTEKLDIQQ